VALKINVGCGAHLIPGWVNIDRTPTAGALPGDATALPVATASAEAVVLLDVLEHLHPTREAPTAIAEAFRVLISGGVIRVSTPDLALLARAYVENKMLDHGQASQPGWYASVSAAATKHSTTRHGSARRFARPGSEKYVANDPERVCLSQSASKWSIVGQTPR